MRAFYRLLNYEFGELLRGVLLICVGLIISTWMFIRVELKDYGSFSTPHERFENVYSSSGMPIVFLVYMLAMLGLFVKSIYASYWGSKSIYTLMTLPVKRELLYLSKLSAFLISMVLLLGSQLMGYVLGYRFMVSNISFHYEGQYLMTNGLFLSFIRSDFMRLLWPYGFINILSTVSIILVIVTGLYYMVLCERSKRRLPFGLVMISYFIMLRVIVVRLDPLYEYSTTMIVIRSLLLLVISTGMMWHSIYLLKKGAIA